MAECHPAGDQSQAGVALHSTNGNQNKRFMYYVYVIKSKNKKWSYIGSSGNLKERFTAHNSGQVKSTKFYKPFDLVYYEAYVNCGMARKREERSF